MRSYLIQVLAMLTAALIPRDRVARVLPWCWPFMVSNVVTYYATRDVGLGYSHREALVDLVICNALVLPLFARRRAVVRRRLPSCSLQGTRPGRVGAVLPPAQRQDDLRCQVRQPSAENRL
jgi:hypothetical protein